LVQRPDAKHHHKHKIKHNCGFDGDELLSRPSIELITVDSAIAKKAEQQIESCENCHPADAEIPW